MSAIRRALMRWMDGLVSRLPLSDKAFDRLMYLRFFRRPLHLDPPVTFNEKIQWLKLFGSSAFLTSLVDKWAVREHVASRIGNRYLNELYGVFDHESDIDFGGLPERFVLRATHGSGWNILCRDKSQLDVNAARAQMRKWLRTNFYRASREPNYRDIPPRILCERFLPEDGQTGLVDLKFFCFSGRVHYVQVDFDRFTNHTRNMYDRDWALCPFRYIYPNHPVGLRKPDNLGALIEVAETLAGSMPFVRVDLYNPQSRIVFGELTFTPESGFGRFVPVEWDYKLGTYLQLPTGDIQRA